jgi:hypothetical protein
MEEFSINFYKEIKQKKSLGYITELKQSGNELTLQKNNSSYYKLKDCIVTLYKHFLELSLYPAKQKMMYQA